MLQARDAQVSTDNNNNVSKSGKGKKQCKAFYYLIYWKYIILILQTTMIMILHSPILQITHALDIWIRAQRVVSIFRGNGYEIRMYIIYAEKRIYSIRLYKYQFWFVFSRYNIHIHILLSIEQSDIIICPTGEHIEQNRM